MARLALACCILLGGCHWLLGHAPPGGSDRAAPNDAPKTDRQNDAPRIDRARPAAEGARLDRSLPKADGPKLDSPKPKADGPRLDSPKPKPEGPKPDSPKPKPEGLKPDTPGKVVTFDGSGKSTVFTSSATWNHTIGCAGAVLVVGIVRFRAGTVASVVANTTTPFTFGDASQRTDFWYLANPPVSTVTIKVSLQSPGEAAAGSVSFCGANTGKLSTWNPGESPGSGAISESTVATVGSAIVGVVVTSAASIGFTPQEHNQLWTASGNMLQAGMGYKIALPSPQIGWSAIGNPSWSYLTGVLWVAP